jgi:hypothetical protein
VLPAPARAPTALSNPFRAGGLNVVSTAKVVSSSFAMFLAETPP